MNRPPLSCALVLAIGLALALPSFGSPRPADPAELAAVEIVSGYLEGGVAEVRARLAPDSPLARLDDPGIELLFGPPGGSRWILQTSDTPGKALFAVEYGSGLEDLVTLELVEKEGAWKLHGVENLSLRERAFSIASDAESEPRAAEASLFSGANLASTGLGLVLLLGVSGVALLRGTARIASAVVVVGALATGGFLIAPRLIGSSEPDSPETSASSEADPLREARWAIETEGADAQPVRAMASENATVALWRAQALLLDMREGEAKSLIETITAEDRDPLRELTLGRIAAAEGDPLAAVLAFERVLESVPASDSLRMEIVQTCLINGLRDRARTHLDELSTRESRLGSPYYLLAILEAVDRDENGAEGLLLSALQIEPVSRRTLFSVPALHALIRRPSVASRVDLFGVEDKAWETTVRGGTPLSVGTGWTGARSGEALYLRSDTARLHLPGLASHAPSSTVLVDPSTWEGMERERVLASPDKLARLASDANSWLQPSLRNDLQIAVVAMDELKRWDEVNRLTSALPERLETVPIDVVIARSLALQGMERKEESRSFAARAAIGELRRENPEPERLYQLGEMMASLRDYDVAIKLLERVEQLDEDVDLTDRIRQLSMTRTLQNHYRSHTTPNFEIRYPDETPASRARKIGEILEAELARIQKRLGVSTFERCTVNLLQWRDFKGIYTKSNHILGFYDGAITVPLADVPIFPPEVVALLTHELTHAVVAQATGGKAPHWFHEGMAGRMQMLPASNAFNRYGDDAMLPVALLDPVLRSSPDPELIEQSYVVSETLVRYLETLGGERAWRDLIAAFAAGKPTEEAIETVSARPFEELDRSFRAWGRAKSRLFLPDQEVLYDEPDRSAWMKFSSAN